MHDETPLEDHKQGWCDLILCVLKLTLSALWTIDSRRRKTESREKVGRVLKSFRKEMMMTWPSVEMIDIVKNYLTQDLF